MGREVKRVPLDFDWPLNKIWEGFLTPDRFIGEKCPDCEIGYSPRAEELRNMWYGYVPFTPEDNGSTPLTPDTPAVRAFAERNVTSASEFYRGGHFGGGYMIDEESAIYREGRRLAEMWNGQWSHHLNQADVDALVEEDRLHDLTHDFDPHRKGRHRWQPKDPSVRPTPEQVNEWAIRSFGHDAINCSIVLRARCEREGVPVVCATCEGHCSVESYPGQRADMDAWERTDPPSGEGWQMWETVSEGSPVTPVFATAEGLARWLTTEEGGRSLLDGPMDFKDALAFVNAGWAPSFVATGDQTMDGPEWVARTHEESEPPTSTGADQ